MIILLYHKFMQIATKCKKKRRKWRRKCLARRCKIWYTERVKMCLEQENRKQFRLERKKDMIKNKIIAVTAVGCFLAASFRTSVSAENTDTMTDLRHLRDALLQQTTVTAADDINGDGIVNVIDLCLLKQKLSTPGEVVTNNYAATAENVKLTGRTMRNQEITWLVQSGSAVAFTVTGTSATITLAGDSSINNEENYRSRYAVLVDGTVIEDAVMSTSEKTLTLFEGEASRTAKVQIIHLSEAMNGAIGVKNISVTSDLLTPISPEPEKPLSIVR